MTESELYDVLTEVFNDVFLRDDLVLRPDMTAEDVPGWDSFRQIDIIMAVEQRFGVKLETREIDGLNNVGDLVNVLTTKTGDGRPA
ncbi:acyl carrier protein [Acidisoma sp. L85]|uniref:acyl carrier protein n=1 Tax=Acidisoma sp. L85 TaxID=1641850 RepID=UPI00131D1DD9|nr:acyl carrier protein [Acidisoma sp. L85]